MENINGVKLGNKIRFFRKRAGLSQFKLENEIGAAPGSLSRIENGEVNPTKETLEKIRYSLKINSRAFRYLDGDLSLRENEDEIRSAIEAVKGYFSKNGVLAYLTDSRLNIQYASRGMFKALGISENFAEVNIYGKSLIQVATDPNLKVINSIDKNSFEDIVFYLLTRFYSECGFMIGDPSYESTVEYINKNELTRKLWKKAQEPDFETISSAEARGVTFKVFGLSISMKYSVESLPSDNRFDIVEYIPTNKIMKLLSKI